MKVRACLVLVALLLVAWGSDAAAQGRSGSGRDVLTITTPPDASTTHLGWADPDTLRPTRERVELGEYHDTWAFSPDRRTIAVGTFARTGVRLIDATTLRVIRDIPMPIAAIGVAWVTPDRLAVLLQRGGAVLVNAHTGRVQRRWGLSYNLPCSTQRRQATTPFGVVFIVAAGDDGAVRLVRIDRRARLRVVRLDGVRAPSSKRTCGAPGFAVDPGRRRAVIVGARGRLAEVDLESLAVVYHASGLRDCERAAEPCTGRRTAVWPASDTVAVAGVNWIARGNGRPTEVPAGAAIVDTADWSARLFDRSAGDVTITAGGLLVTFGGTRGGMRAAALDGSARWSALEGNRIRSAVPAGERLYVLDDPPAATRIVDAISGNVIATATALMRIDVLTGRVDAGDVVAPEPATNAKWPWFSAIGLLALAAFGLAALKRRRRRFDRAARTGWRRIRGCVRGSG